MTRKALLLCGIVGSLVYVVADVIGALTWEGYSYVSQSISELSGIGAPSRPLVVPFFFAYAVLSIAFGLGVWRSAGGRRSLRVLGGLLVGYGIVCLTGPFTPMHLRGAERTLTDRLHVLSTIVDVLFILFMVRFAASAFGQRFRRYSFATIVVVFGFGLLGGFYGPRLEADLPTPWLGVIERISVFAFLLWTSILAIRLLRVHEAAAAAASTFSKSDGWIVGTGSRRQDRRCV
jgi:hypothetical protein